MVGEGDFPRARNFQEARLNFRTTQIYKKKKHLIKFIIKTIIKIKVFGIDLFLTLNNENINIHLLRVYTNKCIRNKQKVFNILTWSCYFTFFFCYFSKL